MGSVFEWPDLEAPVELDAEPRDAVLDTLVDEERDEEVRNDVLVDDACELMLELMLDEALVLVASVLR